MKSIELKTNDVLNAYTLLGNAKYQKLSDDDKIKVWKIQKALKPVAVAYYEETQDAEEKLKPSDTFDKDCQLGAQFEKAKANGEELPISKERYQELNAQFRNYIKLVSDALKESKEKIVKIDFEPLSEDAFGKLMASNDWTLKEVEHLDFIIG